MNSKHSLGTLCETLNAKAAAAGCDTRAVIITLERTWGDLVGIAITGSDRARAVKYAEAYYRQHLSPKRCYDSQYSWREPTEEKIYTDKVGNLFRTSALLMGSDYKGPEWRAEIEAASVEATTVGLVYYPCAD